MLVFIFQRYLSDNYETAAQKELGSDYPETTPTHPEEGNKQKNSPPLDGWQAKPDGVVSMPLQLWYDQNPDDIADFEKQMRRKVHSDSLHQALAKKQANFIPLNKFLVSCQRSSPSTAKTSPQEKRNVLIVCLTLPVALVHCC